MWVCDMKPYFISMFFSFAFLIAHFIFPSWLFVMVFSASMVVLSITMTNYKEPEKAFEWPDLSFTQSNDGSVIILRMETKDGKSIERHLSISRLNLPSHQKIVEKTQSSIWHVLGMMPTTDRSAVEKAFRKMSMVYHPDQGGTSVAFNTLVEAKEKALQKCNKS